MDWFNIRHDNGTANVNIHGEIGVGRSIEDFIQELGETQTVILRLDSCGGDSHYGIKIHDVLQHRNTEVTITGRCYSSALVAIMGARKITCLDTARFLIHQPTCFILGNARQLRFAADGLEKLIARFETIISDRTKTPLNVVRGWVSRETDFSATQALAAGLVDEIIPTPSASSAQATTVGDMSSLTTKTQQEQIFKTWLSMFGKIQVSDLTAFTRELNTWLAMHIEQSPK